MKRVILIAIICGLTACSVSAGDWPGYRHDQQRSGGTDEQLDAAELAVRDDPETCFPHAITSIEPGFAVAPRSPPFPSGVRETI